MTTDPPPPTSLYTVAPMWLIVAALLFAALLNAENDLIRITLVVVGLIGGAWFWSRRGRGALTVGLSMDRERLFPGETVTADLSITNRRFLPLWVQVTTPDHPDFLPAGPPVPPMDAALFWRENARFRWTMAARHRGVFQLATGRVLSGDPLGLFPRAQKADIGPEVIVYPRLVPMRPVTPPPREFFGAAGARSPVVDPVYILGTRDYQPGRPARFIHWRACARHQRWQEKVFEPSAQVKILLVLDVTGFEVPERAETFERALETAASLVVDWHRRGMPCGLITNGRVHAPFAAFTPPDGAISPPERLLETLARLKPQAEEPILNRLVRQPPHRSASVVHISLEPYEQARALRAWLNQRCQPALFLTARGEAAESPAGPAATIDAADGVCAEALP